MRDRNSRPSAPRLSPSRLRLVSSHQPWAARAELFDALIVQLNQAAIPYCVLGGYESNSPPTMSDVDILFQQRDLERVPDLLAQTADSAGALVVQAIQHETTACYFVLVVDDGKHLAHLDVDCYSDYRRDRRAWLLADQVIANRRKYREFYVPSVVDQFTYYVVKKVLKQSIDAHQLKRLQHLFARNPAECRNRLAKLWPPETASLLERAVVEQKFAWFQQHQVRLLNQLRHSAAAERWPRRCLQIVQELGRFLRRIACPTGLCVVVAGNNSVLRSEIADGLICDLAPAFRRTRRIWNALDFAGHLLQTLEVWAARIRSTLVVRTLTQDDIAPGLGRARRLWGWDWIEPLAPCDFIVDLHSGEGGAAECLQNPCSETLCVSSEEPVEVILAKARSAILHLLARRTQGRLTVSTLTDAGVLDTQDEPAKLRSQGLD